MNVRYHKGLIGNSYLPTDSATVGDNGVIRGCTYIRSQNKFLLIAIFEIKTGPVEIRNFSVQNFTYFLEFRIGIFSLGIQRGEQLFF